MMMNPNKVSPVKQAPINGTTNPPTIFGPSVTGSHGTAAVEAMKINGINGTGTGTQGGINVLGGALPGKAVASLNLESLAAGGTKKDDSSSNEMNTTPNRAVRRALKKEQNAQKTQEKQKVRKNQAKASCMTDEEKAQLQKSKDKVKAGMVAHSWKDLESKGRLDQNDRILIVTEKTLVVGVDVASEKHSLRAFTRLGIEVTKKALTFTNNKDGFEKALDYIVELMALQGMEQCIIGIEPTGHYWFNLYHWMQEHNVTVVLVNPYAVKVTKEVDDNQNLKTDEKDPKTIAGILLKGAYSIPYLPEGEYAELRGYAVLKDQAMKAHTASMNRLQRAVNIYFPEAKGLYGKIDATGLLLLFQEGLTPKDIVEIGAEGINQIWRENKLRGQGLKKATEIFEAAKGSIGLKEGLASASVELKQLAEDLIREAERIAFLEAKIDEHCGKLYKVEGILEIRGITINTLAPFLADLGDITRFHDPSEIIKLAGLVPVYNSSGKYKGKSKVSKRGRRRLRKWAYLMALNVVANAPEFAALHEYYTTRPENPLKPMQSLVVIACKLIRIIYKLLVSGEAYDAERMTRDINRDIKPKAKAEAVAVEA